MTLLDKLKEGKEKAVEDIKKKGAKETLKENIIKPGVKGIKEMEVSRIPLKKLQGKLEEIDYPTDREFIKKNIGDVSPVHSLEKNAVAQYSSAGVGAASFFGLGYAMKTALESAGYESLGLLPSLAYLSVLLGGAVGTGLYTLEKMGEHFPSLNSVYLKEELRPEITEEDLEW